MNQPKVLVLGSKGFVGSNIVNVLKDDCLTFGTSRQHADQTANTIFFDLEDDSTWQNIVGLQPEIVINAAGYGVVKSQNDQSRIQKINYYLPYILKNYLDKQLGNYRWMQIGSAFEYDLQLGALTEDSPAMPLTYYGITKLLFSQFLLQSKQSNYVILRPFAMFGPKEDESKIIPALLLAQKRKEHLPLSSGLQVRDYFFVSDLASFIKKIITQKGDELNGQVINIGSNKAVSLKALAEKMSAFIPGFDPIYWQWGKLEQRQHEGDAFYNNSLKASKLGFTPTSTEEAFTQTINFYYQNRYEL